MLGSERRMEHHGKHADRCAAEKARDDHARSRKGAPLRRAAQPVNNTQAPASRAAPGGHGAGCSIMVT